MLDEQVPNALIITGFVDRAFTLPLPRLIEAHRAAEELLQHTEGKTVRDLLTDYRGGETLAGKLRAYIEERASQYLSKNPPSQPLNPEWIADAVYPTARVLMLKDAMGVSERHQAYQAFCELFPEFRIS